MIRVAALACGAPIVPVIATERAGERASWARTASGRVCVAKLASAATSAVVISTVSMTVASRRREEFIRRARNDPRIISPSRAQPAAA